MTDLGAITTAKVARETVLGCLTKARLAEIGRELGVVAPATATKEAQIALLLQSGLLRLPDLLRALGREELKAACRAHQISDAGRERAALVARLMDPAGEQGGGSAEPPPSLWQRDPWTPAANDVVQVRHRQYLVEEVLLPSSHGEATLVRLVCLDDDAQGRRLDVLWELELGARILRPEQHGLGDVREVDQPRHFGAYLHALKWSCVTATDPRLFQAPFRAGILLYDHQLTPLKKALALPRANLFIADDVGLGKTIEAGLVLQELALRQRVDFALIVCPAAVCLQWRDEMEKRFGLHFELYNRAFMARRHQERGFGVNPWTTHARFIISYQLLRRPEYRDPLLQVLGEHRAPKSLLILDEAHTAAPASPGIGAKWTVASDITKVVRDVAPRFENRLFLSATPHNGHSSSFSALMEILDPQRFTRGLPVSAAERDRVMVRRLKSDLRALGRTGFPERRLAQIELRHDGARWLERTVWSDDPGVEEALGEGTDAELRLGRLLAEYTALMRPSIRGGKRAKLVFINLQKRLLSSVAAFHRTLEVHATHAGAPAAALQAVDGPTAAADVERDADEYGPDDDDLEEALALDVSRASRALPTAAGGARALLDEMLSVAEQHRMAPDAKVLSLLAWIRRHQLVKGSRWSDRRVIIFTEYGDTKRYLRLLLDGALAETVEAEERIREFHGGMSDDQREEVQRAFNGPPDEHPLRILIATDAAREGVNLQGHCADLFHYDVPWNPARMEQRNGRIDRTLQPSAVVRCHYFIYPQRPEDEVLRALVAKVDRIQHDLGSLGDVVMQRLGRALEPGIDPATAEALEKAADVGAARAVVQAELEDQRKLEALRADIEEAGEILNSSRRVMEFKPELLRDALDVGCELAGAGRLAPAPAGGAFTLPALPETWDATLDTLRPPRSRDEAFWDWRKRPPLPVVFEAPAAMSTTVAHLHLQHPFVQRVLSRFLAQGYSAHDLSRVTIVRTKHDSLVRAIAFGRLSLFGPGATRLHDEVLAVAARWVEGGGEKHLRPFAEDADRKALGLLEGLLQESPSLEGIGDAVQAKLVAAAPADFGALWPHVQAEADTRAHEAERMLRARAVSESEALRQLLEEQRGAIQRLLQGTQLAFEFAESERAEEEQLEQDKKHLRERLRALEREIEDEPAAIAEGYRVALRRLSPVGLVYLWPATR